AAWRRATTSAGRSTPPRWTHGWQRTIGLRRILARNTRETSDLGHKAPRQSQRRARAFRFLAYIAASAAARTSLAFIVVSCTATHPTLADRLLAARAAAASSTTSWMRRSSAPRSVLR